MSDVVNYILKKQTKKLALLFSFISCVYRKPFLGPERLNVTCFIYSSSIDHITKWPKTQIPTIKYAFLFCQFVETLFTKMRVALFAKHLAMGCGYNITSLICMVWSQITILQALFVWCLSQYYKLHFYGVVTILQALFVWCGHNIASFIFIVWSQYYKLYLFGVVTILQALFVWCGHNIASFICMVWSQYYKPYLYGVVTILQALFVWCGHNVTSFICIVQPQCYKL